MKIKRKIFSNIPNMLSISRILVLPIVAYIIKEGKNINLFTVIFLTFYMLTDFLDGFIARKYNIITRFGKIIDPVADKISIVTISYLIMKYRSFPLWAFIIIIGREILIISGSFKLLKNKDIVLQSNIFGKLATAFVSISLILYILFYEKEGFLLLIAGIIFYIISFATYLYKFKKIYKG